jgi:hypothetical protein
LLKNGFKAFARKAEVGLATNKDVLDVENDLATAKNNQIKAQTPMPMRLPSSGRPLESCLNNSRCRMVDP